jgi:hypothetical protein
MTGKEKVVVIPKEARLRELPSIGLLYSKRESGHSKQEIPACPTVTLRLRTK